MALESVFGTPPPVVGAVDHKDHTMKHGEKQSDDSMADADPEKEEGEIEDGEIIDSGEEEGVAANNGPTVVHFNRMVAGLHPDLENEIEAMGSLKRKKKKKKRRKRMPSGADGENGGGLSGSEDAAPPKSKKHKSHYVDHDRMSDSDGAWFGGSQAYSQRRQERGGESFDSTHRASSPTLQATTMPPSSKRSPSRSPPGLYDSPPESSGDEFNGPSGAERGGSGIYGSFSNSNYDGLGSDYLRRKKGNKSGKIGKRRKGDKRSKGGRSKQNKRKESRRQICKFYLDGKCHKGDECGYSHDQPQTRKMELCKFYLNGFCHKGDACIYMHKDFPCKFFHTGAKCYSADNCKFSHDELTDEMRWVLEKYLDKEDDAGNSDSSLPKHPRPSLLGSPPRHIKEMAAQEALRKIPSLFDIEVEPPPTITPPTGQPQPSRPNFYSDTMSPPNHNRPPLLPFPTSTFDPDPADFPFDEDIRPPFGGPMGGPGGPCNEPCFGNGPSGSNMPPPYCGEPPMMEPSIQDIDERFPPMMDNQRRFQSGSDFDDDRPNMMSRQRGPRHTNDMQQSFTPSWRNSDVDMRTRPHLEMDKDVENLVSNEWDDETTGDKDKGQSSESENDKRSDFAGSNMGSGGCGGGGIPIPLHLPKKQRELFLRIQQQQRQADSSQEDSDKGEWKKVETEVINTELIVTSKWDEEVEDEEEKAVKKAEKESWYSSDDDSDDEDQPLTAVLKKLQQEPLQKQTQQPSLFNITQMLQSITGVKPPTAAINAMESPVNRLELGRDPRSQKPSEMRDPRSNRNTDLRDPRARTLRDPRSMANAAPPEAPLTLRDPRLHFSSSDSNSFDDSKFPSMKEKLKTESWSDVEADTGLSLKTAFHPIPYRLRAMAVSQSVYTNLAQSMHMDPKMFSSDPRLRRQLMNDPRLRRSATLLGAQVGTKKDNKDGLMESKENAEDTKGAVKDILLPRFAQQRLSDDKESSVDAAVTDAKKDVSVSQFGRRSLMEEKDQDLDTRKDVPLPQFGRRSSSEEDAKEMLLPSFGHHRFTSGSKDAPVVSANNEKAAPSPETKLDDHKIHFEEELGSSSDDDDDDSSDDLVIIESVFKDEPDEPVILEAKIGSSSKPSNSGDEGASDEPIIVLESGATPKAPKVDLTYKRKSSMDYASPLGYTNVEPSEASGYDRKSSPKKRPISARSPGPTEGKTLKAQPMTSIPPSPQPFPSIEETASRSPPGGSGANSKSLSADDIGGMAAVESNTSLKDIFKTIDPTASPFC